MKTKKNVNKRVQKTSAKRRKIHEKIGRWNKARSFTDILNISSLYCLLMPLLLKKTSRSSEICWIRRALNVTKAQL